MISYIRGEVAALGDKNACDVKDGRIIRSFADLRDAIAEVAAETPRAPVRR